MRHTSHVKIRIQLRQAGSLKSPTIPGTEFKTARGIHQIYFRGIRVTKNRMVCVTETSYQIQLRQYLPIHLHENIRIVHFSHGLFLTVLHLIIIPSPIPFNSSNNLHVLQGTINICQTGCLLVRSRIRTICKINQIIHGLTSIKISVIHRIQLILFPEGMLQ